MSARRARLATVALSAAACMALALTACSPRSAAEPDPVTPGGVEVFTWWASGSEKLAMDSLVSVFTQQNPDVTYVDGAIAGGAGSAAKDVLASRLRNNDPPDTFQVHPGAELADHVAQGRLQPLDDLYDELELAEVLPPEVLDLLTVDGSVYAVPSNLHRANLVWVNPDVLVTAGLDPATRYASLDEWFVALDAIAASGVTPLAIASTWTQVHLLEQVLLSRLGPQAYAGLWDGTTDPTSGAVASALVDFGRLMRYTNADRDALDWQDAAQLVLDGEAAFTVMGDWAEVPFEARNPGSVVWWPVPGTDDVFDLVMDAFTLPVGARHPEEATAWLRTLASPQAQVTFANAKGALPARTDVSSGALARYQREAQASFVSDTLVPSVAHGAAISPQSLAALTVAVSGFTRNTLSNVDLQAVLASTTPWDPRTS